jgi:hypothetical protein
MGSGASYARLAIFMRLTKKGVLARYWQPTLFVTLLAAGMVCARLLHVTFY